MDITRRGFLKGAIGLAGAGMTGALTVPALKSLLPPPITRCNKDEEHSSLTYKKEDGKWYEADLYRVTEPKGPYEPAKKYLDIMISGATEHNINKNWLKKLKQMRAKYD